MRKNSPMPRPNPPPTPGSSSDLRGKESQQHAPYIVLPPAAFPGVDVPDRASTSSSASSKNGSDSSYRPASPGISDLAGSVRKKSQQGGNSRASAMGVPPPGSVITREDFTLPPPPTRSRKIIQMKPRESVMEVEQEAIEAPPGKGSGKRKSNAGSTAAGRKIARKTAHSLIERRRRSKMNEEFGVLKDMIPACKGQEMHKLAILQASIDYLRYLEQCVSDLQAQNNSPRPPPPPSRSTADEDLDSDEEMDDDNDQQPAPQTAENDDDNASTPALSAVDRSNSLVSLPSLSQITSTSTASPSIFSTGAGARHYSISSTSQASYSPYFHSNQTSPAFGPQLNHVSHHPGTFGLGSPALRPLDSVQSAQSLRQIAEGATAELSGEKRPSASAAAKKRSEHELDQEATAALLMLNNDRRQWRNIQPAVETSDDGRASSNNGGMSVRDLLSG